MSKKLTTGPATAANLVAGIKANVKATVAELAKATPEQVAAMAANMPSTLEVPMPASNEIAELRAELAAAKARIAELEKQVVAAKAATQAVATDKRTVAELRAACKAAGIRGYSSLKKGELLALLAKSPEERSTDRVATGKATVADLKAACKAAGLKVGGTKAALQARLATHNASQGAAGVPSTLAVAAAPVK